MSAKPVLPLLLSMFGLYLTPAPARAGGQDDFAGKYQGTELSVEIAPSGGAYAGQIRRGQSQFPLTASKSGGRLQGVFVSDGNRYDFTATVQGDDLTLVTGGATYALKREVAAANPLAAAPPPANPLAGPPTAPAGGDALRDYKVVASTDSGKALSILKSEASSVQLALEATFPDLARYFDARPAISGAYEDVRDHKSGGASFVAKLKGQPVKGFVSCKIGDKGAVVAVVYCRAGAAPSEWAKLTSAPAEATAENGGAGGVGAAPQVNLRDYEFPDGTGSVGLAEGWQTNAQTCLGPVQIQGPADQRLTVGFMLSVVTPDSIFVQTQRQMEAQARQMGFRPPPPPQVFIAPFTGPADALANLVPQLSRVSQQNGGPAIRLEKILDQKPAKPNLPNGNAALISYTVSAFSQGTEKHYKALAQVETDPMLQGSWMFYAVEAAAPVETFERDLPVMLTMLKSFKTNDRVIQEKTRQNIDAQNRNFAALQQAHREQVDSFDRANKAWERRETIQSRSNADFDEVIRGYRTVEDTQTGNRTSVDLGNVHDVVDKLNQSDPGRYKEVPLRDEFYPLPADQGR